MCILHTFIDGLLRMSNKMCKLRIMLSMIDYILAPLARLLVARGVMFSDFVERFKGHYVQAATQRALKERDKVTDSHISVLTGLQRRDVSRLRAFEHKPPRPNPLTRLVALWQAHPDYRTRALPRTGDAPSFETLAREIRQDVHPRAMLDTLLAAGTVEIDGDKVILKQTAYIPLAGSDEQVDYLVSNVGDHLAAATENLIQDTPPFFERAAHYSGLTDEHIAALKQEFDREQMALLERIAAKAEAAKAQAPKGATGRIRAGGYFYATTQEDNND